MPTYDINVPDWVPGGIDINVPDIAPAPPVKCKLRVVATFGNAPQDCRVKFTINGKSVWLNQNSPIQTIKGLYLNRQYNWTAKTNKPKWTTKKSSGKIGFKRKNETICVTVKRNK